MENLKIMGACLIIIALVLSVIWYDWKLVLILLVVLTGNNMEQYRR